MTHHDHVAEAELTDGRVGRGAVPEDRDLGSRGEAVASDCARRAARTEFTRVGACRRHSVDSPHSE